MADTKGPITLISDLSDKRKRWQALALAWRSAAVSSIPPCERCGRLSAWRLPSTGTFYCDADRPEGDDSVQKLKWQASLKRALEIEEAIERD